MSIERVKQVVGGTIFVTALIGVLFFLSFFIDGPIHLVALGLLAFVVMFLIVSALRWLMRSLAHSAGVIYGEIEHAYHEGKATGAKADPPDQ